MYKVIARNLADGTKRFEFMASGNGAAWAYAKWIMSVHGARSVTVKPL